MTIACPDYLEIVCILAEAILRFSAEILNQKLWQAQYLVKLEGDSCCSAHVVDVSYVKRINHESDFSWQAQSLMKLEDDF